MRHIFFTIIIIFSSIKYSNLYGIDHNAKIEYIESKGVYKISYIRDNGQYWETIFTPATKIDPSINSNIDFIADQNIFMYNYSIRNGNNGKQRVGIIAIEYASEVLNIVNPAIHWTNQFFKFRSIIEWMDSKGKAGLYHPLNGIAPDSVQKGFGFFSPGLPHIASSYFSSTILPTLSFPEEPPEDVEAMVHEFTQTHRKFPANTVQRKTLGPADPPDPFIPSVFADTIQSYIKKSYALDWILTENVSTKYYNFLSSIIDDLNQDNILTAKTTLAQVLTDVETDSGSGLTSEAYALIKYNSKYLYDQLQNTKVSIEDLIAYINDAQFQGTINNTGVAKSLIAKLETARKQLEDEKPKQAVNALNAFLNELKAQQGKHISEEVYAYLKEKVEELIVQIE
ncbi:hypothetical protein ACFL4L_02345 [bacterium]